MKDKKKWKNKNILQIERLQNWTNRIKYQCASCKSKKKPCIEISNAQLCVKCIAELLKDKLLKNINIQDFTLYNFAELLKKGNAVDRLLVLWRIEDVLLIVGKNDGSKIFQLYQSLIKNLGYVQKHPLSAYVRQAAHEAAVFIGDSILPVLVCIPEGISSVHYANIVITAAIISPDHVEVQRLLKKAVYHENTGIRKNLMNAFEHIDDPWVLPLLEIMSTDINPSIKEKSLKCLSKKESPIEKNRKIRKVKIPPDFLNSIQSNYNIEFLNLIYDTYLHQFFDLQYFGMRNRMIKSKLKKHDLIHAFASLFYDEENFWIFMDAVHEDVYTVLERLTWEGGELRAEKLDQTLTEKVCYIEEVIDQRGRSINKNQLNAKYSIFRVRKVHSMGAATGWSHNYFLSLPQFLRTHLKQFLPKPNDYNLIRLNSVPENCHVFSAKDSILFQLPLIWHYVEEGNIEFLQKNDKPNKKELNKMMADCEIEEFYPSGKNEEKHIRTHILACFIHALNNQSFDFSLPTEKRLKKVFTVYFEGSDYRLLDKFKIIDFLTHIKGWRKIYETYHHHFYTNELTFLNELKNILTQLNVGDWISIQNIIHYCFYRNIPVEIVDRLIACHYFHFQYTSIMDGKWINMSGKTYVSESNFPEIITKPAFNMIMFFFASLGVIDIAYSDPENETIRTKNRRFFTEYDGIQYIRLTELGAYAIGKTTTFNSAPKISAEMTLDDQRLIANIKGNDPVKIMILDKMGEKIHDGCFRVNYQTFLKGCRSTKDINYKIEMFEKHISDDPPENWQTFLLDIAAKKNPLTEKRNMRIFKLKDNEELIDLIAKDDVLRHNVLMAEDFHILVLEDNVDIVQKRLEKFGFFVEL